MNNLPQCPSIFPIPAVAAPRIAAVQVEGRGSKLAGTKLETLELKNFNEQFNTMWSLTSTCKAKSSDTMYIAKCKEHDRENIDICTPSTLFEVRAFSVSRKGKAGGCVLFWWRNVSIYQVTSPDMRSTSGQCCGAWCCVDPVPAQSTDSCAAAVALYCVNNEPGRPPSIDW